MNINYDLVIYILEFIQFETLERTKPFASDILLKFEDNQFNKAHCAFIEDRLDQYNLHIDHGYSITYNSQYDESNEILSMGIIISIPDRLKPEDQEEFTQLCFGLIEKFQKFYELSIQFLNNKNRKGSDLNPSYLLS
jgi:hypothetical protein